VFVVFLLPARERLFLFNSDNKEEEPMMSEILFALYFIQSGKESSRERREISSRKTALIPLLALSLALLFS